MHAVLESIDVAYGTGWYVAFVLLAGVGLAPPFSVDVDFTVQALYLATLVADLLSVAA